MKAEDIRRRLAELALDTNEYRINAGGAMVLHGLREETHDLDIWCTKKLGDALAQRCDVQVLPDGTRRCRTVRPEYLSGEGLRGRAGMSMQPRVAGDSGRVQRFGT